MASYLQSVEQIVLKLIQFLQQQSFNIQHRNQQHYQQIQSTNHVQQPHPCYITPPGAMIPSPAALIPSQALTIHHHGGQHLNHPIIRINHHHPLQPRMMIPHLYNNNRTRGPPPRIH